MVNGTTNGTHHDPADSEGDTEPAATPSAEAPEQHEKLEARRKNKKKKKSKKKKARRRAKKKKKNEEEGEGEVRERVGHRKHRDGRDGSPPGTTKESNPRRS